MTAPTLPVRTDMLPAALDRTPTATGDTPALAPDGTLAAVAHLVVAVGAVLPEPGPAQRLLRQVTGDIGTVAVLTTHDAGLDRAARSADTLLRLAEQLVHAGIAAATDPAAAPLVADILSQLQQLANTVERDVLTAHDHATDLDVTRALAVARQRRQLLQDTISNVVALHRRQATG